MDNKYIVFYKKEMNISRKQVLEIKRKKLKELKNKRNKRNEKK